MAAGNGFYTSSITFTAPSTPTTVIFTQTSSTDASPLIDNVVISAVPEPSGVLLLATLLLGVGVACRRAFGRV